MASLPNRRSTRLKGYDYSVTGVYFITVCVEGKKSLLGEVVGTRVVLSDIGEVVKESISTIETVHSNARILASVVMPNHIHILLLVDNNDGAFLFGGKLNLYCDAASHIANGTEKTVGSIVRGFKAAVTKTLGYSIFQRGFFDHIVRTEESYQRIEEYIRLNPYRWGDDCYFVL